MFEILSSEKFLLLLLLAWIMTWKGLALWRSARNKQTKWFIILLIFNSVSIIEIIYLIFFQKNKRKI